MRERHEHFNNLGLGAMSNFFDVPVNLRGHPHTSPRQVCSTSSTPCGIVDVKRAAVTHAAS